MWRLMPVVFALMIVGGVALVAWALYSTYKGDEDDD